MKLATQVYIGLGSNLAEPITQLEEAVDHIKHLEHVEISNCSSLYASTPMGPQDQPDYVNAVVEISTSLEPIALLKALQAIEQQHGRVRKAQRWGPRTLDLDILLYGQLRIDQVELVVPHYGMKQREFVLYPLFEIAPELVLPCGESLQSLLQNVPENGLQIVKHRHTQ